jgi:cytochrome c oxidase assembly protein subunit 15
MLEHRDKRLLRPWLWSGIILVIFMVAVGGITRLTGSGLSIVKWKIVTGTIPPLSHDEWQQAFDEYKVTPQFKQINKNFTVEGFKGIYWWEYIHRLIGRFIGLLFIIPFVWFLVKRSLPRWLVRDLTIILVLGALQGVMGWVMVMSGLSDLPYVSHYRLALHLSLAIMLVAVILWTIMKIDTDRLRNNPTPWLLYAGGIILFCQIILGAFVAGLKAGFYYNTFPLMGGSFIPENLFTSIQNGVFIQFAHRWVAFITGVFLFAISIRMRGYAYAPLNRKANALAILTITQILLGIFTLIYRVPVWLGVLHQVTAVILCAVLVAIVFDLRHRLDRQP